MAKRPDVRVNEDGKLVPFDPEKWEFPDIVYNEAGEVESYSLRLLLMVAVGLGSVEASE